MEGLPSFVTCWFKKMFIKQPWNSCLKWNICINPANGGWRSSSLPQLYKREDLFWVIKWIRLLKASLETYISLFLNIQLLNFKLDAEEIVLLACLFRLLTFLSNYLLQHYFLKVYMSVSFSLYTNSVLIRIIKSVKNTIRAIANNKCSRFSIMKKFETFKVILNIKHWY